MTEGIKEKRISQTAVDMSEYEPENLYLIEMTKVDLKEYRELLQRLKKNKKNVPRDILLAKYKKPYNRLRNEIADMTSRILKDIVLSDLKVKRDEFDEACVVINRTIAESGILQEVSHAVYQEQDADKVLEYAVELRRLVQQALKEIRQ